MRAEAHGQCQRMHRMAWGGGRSGGGVEKINEIGRAAFPTQLKSGPASSKWTGLTSSSVFSRPFGVAALEGIFLRAFLIRCGVRHLQTPVPWHSFNDQVWDGKLL